MFLAVACRWIKIVPSFLRSSSILLLERLRRVATLGVKKILITRVVLNFERFVKSFVVFVVPLCFAHGQVSEEEVVIVVEFVRQVLLVLAAEGVHKVLKRLLFLYARKSTETPLGIVVAGVKGSGLALATASVPSLILREKVVQIRLVLGE